MTNWTRGHLIGHGSSAQVFLAKLQPSDRQPDTQAAVKSTEFKRSSLLQREREILSSIRCPHVIEYRGCGVTLETGRLMYNVLLEYASGGTLSDAIYRSSGRRLEDPKVIRSYTRGILLGLSYLHRNGIVHCDIKPTNILLVTDNHHHHHHNDNAHHHQAKIADLGLARRLAAVDDCNPMMAPPSMTAAAGTPMYMAPEAVRGEQQRYAADVWSLGCTVLEMVTGKPPWSGVLSDPISALYMIGFSDGAPQVPEFLSVEAKDFLGKCLKRDPEERWSCDELLMHPFVVGGDNKAVPQPSSCPLPHLITSSIAGKRTIAPAPSTRRRPPDSDTPTSILDHGIIWESTSVNHDVQADKDEDSSLLVLASTPPEERIRRLIGHTPAETTRSMPNWSIDSDEAWLTVRTNDGAFESAAMEMACGSPSREAHDLLEVDCPGPDGHRDQATDLLRGTYRHHNVNVGTSFCQTRIELDRPFCIVDLVNCCCNVDAIKDDDSRMSGLSDNTSVVYEKDLSNLFFYYMKIDHGNYLFNRF